MSFMFNFPNPEDDSLSSEKTTDEQAQDGTQLKPCEEIYASDITNPQDFEAIPTISYKLSDDVCVRCLQSGAVEERLCRQSSTQLGAVQAAQSHSDLLPNVYEGGLKVWECAIDLAQYLCIARVSFQGKTVAELGCGAGVPGIVAMKQGASQVHFQDYNEEVIQHYTIPNVSMNTPEGCVCQCRYFTGDWDSFRQKLAKQDIRYDVILTAETIYRQENYKKLSLFFQHCLSAAGVVIVADTLIYGNPYANRVDPDETAPTGAVSSGSTLFADTSNHVTMRYLAAKSNYFGVGGGTQDFASYLDKQGTFNTEMCHTVEEANRVDPDETAPTGAVSSGSTLFAYTSNHVTMRIVADTLIYGTPYANRVDPDEITPTAPTGAVSSGSTLFANTSNHVTMRSSS